MIAIQYVNKATGEVVAETRVTGNRGSCRFLDRFLADDEVAEALRRRDAVWVDEQTLRIEGR